MMNMYTPTPDYYNDVICHYGVKGMKWRRRKGIQRVFSSKNKKKSIFNNDHYDEMGNKPISKEVHDSYKPKKSVNKNTHYNTSSKSQSSKSFLQKFKETLNAPHYDEMGNPPKKKQKH